MKRLKTVKLTRLSESELGKKELNKLKGGGCCICGAGGGTDNASANYSGDLYSPAGGYGWGY
jgi:natural product precursor